MSNIWSLIKKEVRAYFSSPIAYAVLFAVTLIFGWMFYNLIMYFNLQSLQAAQNPYYAQQMSPTINERVFAPLFGNMSLILVFVTPLLTMRLLAEEKKNGTDELLYTSPLTVGQILLGKYLAAMILLAAMFGLTALLSAFAFVLGNPELAPWLTGYLGLFLMGGAYIGIGLFFSSLTENQIVAAVLTFLTLLLFFLLHWISTLGSGAWKGVVDYLAFSSHLEDMTRGVLDTKDIVYYLSFSAFGLFLAHSVLQSRRWR